MHSNKDNDTNDKILIEITTTEIAKSQYMKVVKHNIFNLVVDTHKLIAKVTSISNLLQH